MEGEREGGREGGRGEEGRELIFVTLLAKQNTVAIYMHTHFC